MSSEGASGEVHSISDSDSSEEKVENTSGASSESLEPKDEIHVPEDETQETRIPSEKRTESELPESEDPAGDSTKVTLEVETSIQQKNECKKLEEEVPPVHSKTECKPQQANETETPESVYSPEQSDERKENKSVFSSEQNDEIKTSENLVPIESNVPESVFPEQKDANKAPESEVPPEKKDATKVTENVVSLEQNDETKASEKVHPPKQKAESEAAESVVPLEQKAESVVPLEQKAESVAPESEVPPKQKDANKVTEKVDPPKQKAESEAPESVVPLEQYDETKAPESVIPPEQKGESKATENVFPPEQKDESKATESVITPEQGDGSKETENVVPLEQNGESEASECLVPHEQGEESKPGRAVSSEQNNVSNSSGSVISPEQRVDSKVSGDLVSTEQSNDTKTPEVVVSSKQNDRRDECEGQIPPKQTIELEASEGHLPSQQNEIETSEHENYSDRKVIEYARITWAVEKLSLSDTRSYCVKSSNFRIDVSSESIWYLGLEWSPESDINQRKYKRDMREKAKRERAKRKDPRRNLNVTPFEDPRYLLLNLVKLPNKINPKDSVRVSFRIGYKNVLGCILWVAAVHTHFGRNHRRPAPIVIDIENYQETYTFFCDLVIYNYKHELCSYPSYEMSALRQVHIYLRDLWIGRKSSDVTILAGNQEMAAHKYILHARSAFFRKMIDGNYSNILDLNSESWETLDQLLYFVYTGDIDVLAEKGRFSFDLFECAERLEIQGLDELLTLNKISLLTFSSGISIEYQWIIKNYASYEDGKIKSSPELESSPMETLFKNTVKYRIKFVKNRRLVGLFAEAKSDQEADVLAEIYMLDDKGDKVNARFYSFTSPEIYFGGDTDFALVESSDYYIPKVVNDDSITVVIKLNVSQCNYTSRVETFTTSGVTDIASGSFSKLSQDMCTVLKEGLGSDMIIRTADKEFKVHKVILQANSVAFIELAEHIGKGEVLECPNVPGNVMEAIIKFLYAGRLEETDVDVLYQIYETTSVYDAGCLRDFCFERLRSSFSAENVCKLLHKYYTSDSSQLVDAAIHFICCNAATILLSNEWKELKSKSSTLRNDVLNRLTTAFKNKSSLLNLE